MGHILNKPYEENQRLDFIVKYNHKNGLQIIESSTALYALEEDEILENGNIEKNQYFEIQKRISEINLELQRIQLKLDNLDLKTIRALREGGFDSSGTSFLELYQIQINELREQYTNFLEEKLNLEKGEQNDITK